MTKEYLEVQKELQWMTKYCNDLAKHLEQTRRQHHADEENQRRANQLQQPVTSGASDLQRSVEEFVQLENEKKSLIQLHRNLKEQLNRARSDSQPPPPHQARSPPLPDDGWVVLERSART